MPAKAVYLLNKFERAKSRVGTILCPRVDDARKTASKFGALASFATVFDIFHIRVAFQ